MSSDFIKLTPAFLIHLNGRRLPVELECLVKEITIKEQINAPSTFTVFLAVPMTTNDDVAGWLDNELFSEGTQAKIELGYKDEIKPVFNGEVTSCTFEYTSDCKGIISIRGYDRLHRLTRGKKNISYAKKSDSDIIQEIASSAGLNSDIASLGKTNEFLLQKQMTDLQFIRHLVMKNSHIFWCRDNCLKIKEVDANVQEDVILEREKNLVNFRLTISAESLPTQVEVRGWDGGQFEPVVTIAGASDIAVKLGGKSLGLETADGEFGSCKMTIVDESINDMVGAEKAAAGILTDISFNYIKGDGLTIGNPEIRSASILKLLGIGKRFSGKYLVQSVKHKLSPTHGYSTYFSIKRNCTDI